MTKTNFTNRFGLIALVLSLFASTAFAASTTQPFQTSSIGFYEGTPQLVVHVPNNQRLVVEQISGYCSDAPGGILYMYSDDPVTHNIHGAEYVSSDVTVKTISDPARFYADPGLNLNLRLINSPGGICHITVSGYFTSL